MVGMNGQTLYARSVVPGGRTDPESRAIIDNIPIGVTENMLRKRLAVYGDARVHVFNAASRHSKGWAWVSFATASDTQKLVDMAVATHKLSHPPPEVENDPKEEEEKEKDYGEEKKEKEEREEKEDDDKKKGGEKTLQKGRHFDDKEGRLTLMEVRTTATTTHLTTETEIDQKKKQTNKLKRHNKHNKQKKKTNKTNDVLVVDEEERRLMMQKQAEEEEENTRETKEEEEEEEDEEEEGEEETKKKKNLSERREDLKNECALFTNNAKKEDDEMGNERHRFLSFKESEDSESTVFDASDGRPSPRESQSRHTPEIVTDGSDLNSDADF